MNTKFDIGQRVTYPVTEMHEAKIDAIQIGKDGKPRYSVGGRMVLELELKEVGVVFEKPAPASDKPEPAKLYCVHDDPGWLTKGKVYEFSDGRIQNYDNGWKSRHNRKDYSDWSGSNLEASSRLVHLVKRPAKVGEWVYIVHHNGGAVAPGTIWKVVGFKSWGALDLSGGWALNPDNYLVLDGYHGEQEE